MKLPHYRVVSHRWKGALSYFEAVYYPSWSRYNCSSVIMLQVNWTMGSGEATTMLVTCQRTWSGINLTWLGEGYTLFGIDTIENISSVK